MKFILPHNYILVIVTCITTNFIDVSHSEPYVSRSSITAVKLVKGNPRNRSAIHKQEQQLFGNVAKVSRVIPAKRLTKKSSKIDSRSEFVPHLPLTEKLTANHGKIEKVVDRNVPTAQKLVSVSPPTTTTKPKPLVLSENSWDYLNSVVTDDELRKVISGLPKDILSNATIITKKDPVRGQNYLFNSILDQLSNMKLPETRMLEESDGKTINKGVRFSAKRKPVLNVMPAPPMENPIGKQSKNNAKIEIDQRNMSGHITNSPNKSSPQYSSNLEKPETIVADHIESKKSTTPSIMNVIAAPERRDLTTPFVPSILSNSNSGFVPVVLPIAPISPPSYLPLPATNHNISANQTEFKTGLQTPSVRKPRGPPKEANYLLPPITSSTGPETVNKGYQTIPEYTTSGPKVVWYSHNQTPEDTFFPNSDGYLVPPEESSLEFLTDLALLAFPNGSSENQIPSSESSSSSSSDTKKEGKTATSAMKGLMKENGSGRVVIRARSNGGSRIPENPKKTDKNHSHRGHLQTAATYHDVIPDNEEWDHSTNGGAGRRGRNGYRNDDDGKQHFTSSYKINEVPSYQGINGKPRDDILSYGAYNEEVDHFHHDSYPNKHEIGSYHGNANVYKGEFSRPQNSYNDNGNFPPNDNRPNSYVGDGDYGKRPEKSKQNSAGHGWGHKNNYNQQYGHYGWKEPSKDFFDLAKDYLKNSDLSASNKWFDITIGVLAFLAFGGYIIMLLYQVFTVGSGTQLGLLVGRSFSGAGEVFDTFFSKGPIGQAYMDELETIVKRAMANVKRIWTTSSIGTRETAKVKGEVDVN
ncbi:unnamed protein product [Orchesella dallaii]|uniref:Uncharacterized protein n=1 Tax=Orchesella dallaii TaxID=48710 RepID=A0ABP1QWS5_9HEXA